jgi:N-acetyl-anhydromuramyl-L-alanine amidase AmpD
VLVKDFKLNIMTRSFLFFVIVLTAILFSAGCDGGYSTPEITGREPVFTPVNTEPLVVPEIPHTNNYGGIPSAWYPPKKREKRWNSIMIHHTATTHGNAAEINGWHKDRGWEGVGYDFVINNGNGARDGIVEVTFRWKEQIPGAHVGGTPNNWANVNGIGVCLVGDFSKRPPSRKQMASLTKLVRFLQKRYRVPTSRIYTHKNTPDAHPTDCPGKYFPMQQFLRSL